MFVCGGQWERKPICSHMVFLFLCLTADIIWSDTQPGDFLHLINHLCVNAHTLFPIPVPLYSSASLPSRLQQWPLTLTLSLSPACPFSTDFWPSSFSLIKLTTTMPCFLHLLLTCCMGEARWRDETRWERIWFETCLKNKINKPFIKKGILFLTEPLFKVTACTLAFPRLHCETHKMSTAVGGQVIFLSCYLCWDKPDMKDPQHQAMIGCFALNFSHWRFKGR